MRGHLLGSVVLVLVTDSLALFPDFGLYNYHIVRERRKEMHQFLLFTDVGVLVSLRMGVVAS